MKTNLLIWVAILTVGWSSFTALANADPIIKPTFGYEITTGNNTASPLSLGLKQVERFDLPLGLLPGYGSLSLHAALQLSTVSSAVSGYEFGAALGWMTPLDLNILPQVKFTGIGPELRLQTSLDSQGTLQGWRWGIPLVLELEIAL